MYSPQVIEEVKMQLASSIRTMLQRSRHYVWIHLLLVLVFLSLFVLAAGAPFSGGGPGG